MSGCTTLDTLTTVCSSTPPLPAAGIGPGAFLAAYALLAAGYLAVYVAGRR